MPAAVVFRNGAAADAPALAKPHAAARAAAMPDLVERHDIEVVAGWLATTLATRHRMRVATAPGIPVGGIAFGQDAAHGPMVLHLHLDPGWRRRGIGPRLSLPCIARNTGARAFYERHGFRVAATGDGAGTEDGEPDILYARDAGTPDTDITTSGSTP